MTQPQTLGELRRDPARRSRGVKDEMRENLLAQARGRGDRCSPACSGYEDTVVPQVVNAILSRHNLILLGLRGQAKSRLLRSLTTLLDERDPDGGRLRDPRRPVPAALQALPRPGRRARRRRRRSPG